MMTTTTNAATETSNVHPFERAGLGKAPFRFVGMVEQDLCYGQRILNREEYQRTGIAITTKPGGTCAFCGTYIVNMFQIVSSDGRRFHVGCDCVEKVGDAKLVRAVSAAKRAHDRKRRETRRAETAARDLADLRALLSDPSVRERLAAMPHPTAYMASKGETMLGWADWILARAGATGRGNAVKIIKGAL